MKTITLLVTLFALSIYLIGCNDDDNQDRKIVGTGPIVTETLELSSFDKIELTGVANFYITIGSSQSVVLKAQQNIIDIMTWEVNNRTLKVGLEKGVSIETDENIRFDVTISAIELIDLLGVGDFTLSGADQDELSILLVGVGNVYAYDMKVDTCNITSSGVGNCEVYVLSELNVTITGVGSVYYKGDPAINSTITGVGDLVDAN